MKFNYLFIKTTLPMFLLLATVTSCEETKDSEKENNIVEFLTENNEPIPDVTIKNDDVVLGKSDRDGNFVIDKELKINSVLVFEHKDFINRYIVVNKNRLAAVYMKRRNKAIRIDSKEGKKIVSESNVIVEIPQNAFSQNGKPYYGEVDITISNIDASNSFDIRTAPAPFIAQDQNKNTLSPLTSFGIVEILAVTPKGIPLDLTKGTRIGISIPVTTENTPDKVNLYELNTETGYWNQKGVLVNTNNTLLGEITSVNSSWNADEPCSSALVCVQVKIEYSNGVNHDCYGSYVGAEGLSYQGFDGPYFPDASGYVYFWVCPNSVFELQNCYATCTCPGGSGPIHTKMIDLSTVTMNSSGCTDLGTWTIQ